MKQAALMSGADASTNQTSVPFFLADLSIYTLQVSFTGTPNGSVVVQASNDNVNWGDVPNTSQTVTAGSPNIIYTTNAAGYPWVRGKWTNTSGTGTITMYIVAKENRIVGA